jgi:hypothetical protein
LLSLILLCDLLSFQDCLNFQHFFLILTHFAHFSQHFDHNRYNESMFHQDLKLMCKLSPQFLANKELEHLVKRIHLHNHHPLAPRY